MPRGVLPHGAAHEKAAVDGAACRAEAVSAARRRGNRGRSGGRCRGRRDPQSSTCTCFRMPWGSLLRVQAVRDGAAASARTLLRCVPEPSSDAGCAPAPWPAGKRRPSAPGADRPRLRPRCGRRARRAWRAKAPRPSSISIEEGPVRARFERGHVYLTYKVLAKFTPIALIDDGRIQKSVAEDDLARFQRGKDDVVHVLGAAGGEQERLALGGHGARLAVGGVGQHERADALGHGAAARLARAARSPSRARRASRRSAPSAWTCRSRRCPRR